MNLSSLISNSSLSSSGFTFSATPSIVENRSKYEFGVLDKVYHSNTMHEMKVNADIEGVDLNDVDVLAFLIEQTAYHHAFWSHTSKRFTALKNLLRYDKNIEKASRSKCLIDRVETKLDFMESRMKNDPVYNVPGHVQEIKNYKQVLDILKRPVGKRRKRAANA